MPSSGAKRGRGRPPGSARARKKQKRLDAIFDKPKPLLLLLDPPPNDDEPRRSSRVRRPPAVLDSSPVPAVRFKKPKPSASSLSQTGANEKTKKEKEEMGSVLEDQGLEVDGKDWKSRLRSRVGKGKGRFARVLREGKEMLKPEKSEERDGLDLDALKSRRKEKKKKWKKKKKKSSVESIEVFEIGKENKDQVSVLCATDEVEKVATEEVEEKVRSDSQVGSSPEKEMPEILRGKELSEILPEKELPEILLVEEEVRQEVESISAGQEVKLDMTIAGAMVGTIQQSENVVASDNAVPHSDEKVNSVSAKCHNMVPSASALDDKALKSRVKEGRRCGLCGGGTDGKPPKKLVQESVDSDNEAYEGSSASEEPNYDVWDGFGDEPGWLGRLLGPIHDRFGIARVWVHQHCAVWSPEVYFAGLGCLKNVRAALCRGRALKCSRCGRPGATIGCRVDRCPKTYHLPCSRAESCIFDHHKFLIACYDHRHLFQPSGNDYSKQIRKLKAKKLKLEIRKLSNDAWRKDLEAEDKWLENCGEDEEFLKREGKRLHRDILRISPVYIGGSSENEKLYQGWESVAGLQDVIQCMKEVVILPLLYPEFYSNLGLTPPRGILLHGYPGTGKTLVVRALIGACSRSEKRIAYFARKGADCLGKYVGDAERQLRLLFQVAERSQPSIIFFDEIDGLAPCRSRHQDQTHSSVVSTLLSLMDGLKSRGSVIVIGATNRPEAVDPALRRPGRFDREIYFPLPSEKDRSAILSLHTRSWPNPVSGPILSWIANQTVGYAGADLQALCTQAAMNALKRNCALQELLASAEKGFGNGRLPSLPSLIVEKRDWLTALAMAPPPCSRREAGIAANDVVSSPLRAHLIPCLLRPLSHLLISFYNDERILLPPALFEASKLVRNVIISALEQKSLPIAFCLSHLHHLVQEPYIAKEIERSLACLGLVTGPAGFSHSYMSEDDDEKLAYCKMKTSSAYIPSNPLQKFSLKLRNLSGFRTLISGTPKAGQHHLASCLLHGFMGHFEIRKVNLATISQEGHGDILRGLTQILLKCLNVGQCIIYMPRIDLWAISETPQQGGKESHNTSSMCEVHDTTKVVSELWNSFTEQMDSMCISASLFVLATCEVESVDLPLGIRQFFTSDVLLHTNSATSEHTIPRFFVHIDGTFDHELVINAAAAKLSHDLVQHYVQLVHQRTHLSNSHDKHVDHDSGKVSLEVQQESMADRQATPAVGTVMETERINSNNGASRGNDQTQQGIHRDPMSQVRASQEVGTHVYSHQDSFSRTLHNKVTKGSSMLAISIFGYQILRYPQFAELCWITSKLKDGPSTDIKGPWKGWPFNSCVMHDSSSSSPNKAVDGVSNPKDRDHSGVVRGLTAVGLLAYRGVYTSVREVSAEVRSVLELLVEHIRAKTVGRKERYRYFRILSQVAYVEDMVNSWVYTSRSLPTENQMGESTTKPEIVGRLNADNNPSLSNIIDKKSCVPNPNRNCSEAQEFALDGTPYKCDTNNGQCANTDKGLADLAADSSDASMIPEVNHLEENATVAPFCPSLHPTSSFTAVPQVDGDGCCRSESLTPSKRLDGPIHSNGVAISEDRPMFKSDMSNFETPVSAVESGLKENNKHCNGLDTVLSHNNCQIPDEQDTDNGKDNHLASSEVSCLYDCCSGCLHAIDMLVHDIVYDCWKSDGCCSTVDDIHEVVASCSSNLITTCRKSYLSRSRAPCSENCDVIHRTQSDHCVSQDVGGKEVKKISCQHSKSKKKEFLPEECGCHPTNKEDTAATPLGSSTLFRSVLKFFFKDGALVSSEASQDDTLHCRYGRLCLCTLTEILLATKLRLN